MAEIQQFALPDVGEGLTEAEIVSWSVQPGDIVETNQVIVEIETAKSLVELPSPFAGEVVALHFAEGETVDVGAAIISISTGALDREPHTGADAGAVVDPVIEPEEHPEEEPKLLVGYGPGAPRPRRRRGADDQAAPATAPIDPATTAPIEAAVPIRCTPPVRKLAKDLGVDLATVTPTGPATTITQDDVLSAADTHRAPRSTAESSPEIRIPIRGVRKHTAAAMVSSAFTAPHVSEYVTFDITRSMELRSRLAARKEFADVKLSPLSLIARAFVRAIERTPISNSRWEEATQEIVQLSEINLGIAAATPRGLVVPNIRSAQRLGLRDLSVAIADLAATARAGKTAPEDMNHGTATISNFGMFGVDAGTPILNPGETVILGVGSITRRPWVLGSGDAETLMPRWVTTLSLSFDHRVLDGQQASELLADTAAFLREPELAVL
ncbi:dihydrolipoamide acetyltransferase family protein [Microbacterium oxydans]|uniref:Dihydrolipoamide acetyltransferase component of pyruvate dehydrogenase complex n=1 Tax=Microbacterium oxydans TaxID=82380 RepID=A0A0F0LA24_9MICO|nr:dihydrolipoamide acetyltransferase family protein [Microbacterium oxydans]KJL30047.1 Dihydrolipoyllysine-residue acetyltransferase component of pyruvate dehydrogenase complex [Microbacterium oxydans]